MRFVGLFMAIAEFVSSIGAPKLIDRHTFSGVNIGI